MQANRRTFLKGTLATGAISVAMGAGLLTPRAVFAREDDLMPQQPNDSKEWPRTTYKSPTDHLEGAVKDLTGIPLSAAKDSGDIKIKAPDIAENGAQVPVTVNTKLAAEQVVILVEKNRHPIVADFILENGAAGTVGTRIKMGETSNVIALVKVGGDLFKAAKEVKVTIGGCGG